MGMTAREENEEEGRTTFNNIRGMDVYDADGEPFGHVHDIEINKTTLNPTKLVIHKGFFGEYMRVDLKYIDKITSESIHLWISPAKNLVGTRVIDTEGDEMGDVKEAEKGKDGGVEYIRVETGLIRTKNDEEEHVETYAVPMLSFEDMSVTLPAPVEEGGMATSMDMTKESIYIEADEIIDVGKDCIRLKKRKEEYIK
ncbi:MAG: PRC-barrel domain-containing protein [Candidatus Thermoplasmatota archaeon]